MKIGYNPLFAGVIIVLGLINLVLGFLLLSATEDFNASIVLGPILTLFGILSLTRAYFEFDATTGTIATKALIGPVSRRFGGTAGGRLSVMGNRIVHLRADGTTKKVPVAKFMANPQDWRAVLAAISGPTAGPAAW